MKKETIIAIILGLTLGTIVAFFLVFKTQEKKIENTKTIGSDLKITPKVAIGKAQVNFQPLEITGPENNILTDKDSVQIKGKTVKKSLIIIQSPLKEATFENKDENFTIDFPLALGENTIAVTSYNKNLQHEPQTKELKIYYLNE